MKLLENTLLDSISSFLVENAVDFPLDIRLETYSCKMVNTDKKEWKRSIKNSGDGEAATTTPAAWKNGKEQLHLLSPTPEDGGIYSSTPSASPILTVYSVLSSGSYGGVGGVGARYRHLSEASAGSENNNDNNNLLDEGRALVVKTVSRRCLFDMISLLNLSYPDYDFSETKSESFTSCTPEECIANVNGKLFVTVSDYSRVREHIWLAIDNEIKLSESTIYSYLPGYDSDSPFTEDGCIWSFNYMLFNKAMKRFLFFACRALRSTADSGSVDDLPGFASDTLWDVELGD